MDEVGQPGVVQPGDGSRDDAAGSRGVADEVSGPGFDLGDSDWPDGDPLGMAWPKPTWSAQRASSDWYGQATARNTHDRYPTSGGEPYPSEGSGGHVRASGERHPSDPRGFVPLRSQPRPSSPTSLAGPEPERPKPAGREPSAGAEPRSESPSHVAPGSESEAWRAPDGDRYWSRTSTGPARGSVPLTDALTAETIEAPLLASAAARPYGEPVLPSIRLPQVFVPRPRAGDSYGGGSPDAAGAPDNPADGERTPRADPNRGPAPGPDTNLEANPASPTASGPARSPYARASAAVPVRAPGSDAQAFSSSIAERRTDLAPSDAGPSTSDGVIPPGPAMTPPRPRTPSPAPVASEGERHGSGDRPPDSERASGEHSTSGQHRGSDGSDTSGEPAAAIIGGPSEPPRPAAIPMPGRSPHPDDRSAEPESAASREPLAPDNAGAGPSGAQESGRIDDPAALLLAGPQSADAAAADDVPPIFRQTANPSPADEPPADAPSWSPPRETRNRRGPWLRGSGSIRSGRFGGRPISMFSSSSSSSWPPAAADESRPSEPSAPEVSPDSGDVSAPTIAMRPAVFPAAPDPASADQRSEVPPDPHDAWRGDQPVQPTTAPVDPPGAAEYDWDDGHRFALIDPPALPHRVPAKPDVPFADTGELDALDDFDVFDEVAGEVAPLPTPDLDGPELSRIASRLRHDEQSAPELPDELDVAAVLAAVRQVHGVRSAQLRPNPGGVHILRLDLADDADAGRVSRQVARLLKERMGLAAEPRRERNAPGPAAPASESPTALAGPSVPAGPNEAAQPSAASPPSARAAASESGTANVAGSTDPAAAEPMGSGQSGSTRRPAPPVRSAPTPLTPSAPADPSAPSAPAAPSASAQAPSASAQAPSVPSGSASAPFVALRPPSTPPPSTPPPSAPPATPPPTTTRPASTGPGGLAPDRPAPGGPTVSGAPGFRPTMPGEPGAFLPGMATVAPAAPLPPVPGQPARIVIDQVHVSTLGTEATVEVRLHFGAVATVGKATGPAVDAYLLRLAAQAAAGAIDALIVAAEIGSRSRGATGPTGPTGSAGSAGGTEPAGSTPATGSTAATGSAGMSGSARSTPSAPMRCYIEHAGVVPFGSSVVAVVVVLVSGDGRVEQLVGSALVAGDPRHSIVRATLAAVNRRLESLLT